MEDRRKAPRAPFMCMVRISSQYPLEGFGIDVSTTGCSFKIHKDDKQIEIGKIYRIELIAKGANSVAYFKVINIENIDDEFLRIGGKFKSISKESFTKLENCIDKRI